MGLQPIFETPYERGGVITPGLPILPHGVERHPVPGGGSRAVAIEKGDEISVLDREGLQSADGTLHPVQQAFIDELSPQCGFCTPGQIMSTVALLGENPTPTREEARQALSGNLCRCGAYDHYLNGVMRASGQNS